ncbi:MAG TPA: hypothetical protein VHF25_00570 [Nitriliruptorales bacterium]|nr:hypothetical protein [Nitriliruptorales bacterium]
MNRRTKNLALAGGAMMVVGFVAVNTLVAPAAPTPSVVASPDVAAAQPAAVPSPAPSSSVTSVTPGGSATRRSYAIGLQDLAGFPPDAPPGARLELWVTWEPPVTQRPRLQKLIGDVMLERTIPGSVPEAPVSVLLSVPEDRVADLIYADGFGKLSVVLPW